MEWGITAPRVILFGDIPTIIPSTSVVAPKTSTIAPVISSAAPMVETTRVASPLDCVAWFPIRAPDSSDGPHRRTLMLYRCVARSRVHKYGPSSSHEFPIAPVTAPPGIRRRSVTIITHLLPVYSLDLDAPDQAHSGPSTRDVLPELCYFEESTTDSSSGDSSERPMHLSPHFAGPSRKRCRSPVDSVPLPMPVTGSLAPTRADLSPPRKRFRDLYSSETSIEEDAEVGLTGTGVDIELDASAGDTAEVGIDPMTAPLVEEEIVEPAGEDFPDSPDTRDGIVWIVGIETAQRRLEVDQLIANFVFISPSQEEFCQIRRDRADVEGLREVGVVS
ncbi:hypothetical protein Tco_0536668 [Tanacetum coccineum]